MMRIGGTVVLAVALLACGRGTVVLPRVTSIDPGEGFKMLRPGAKTTDCRARAIWIDAPVSEDEATRALGVLLGSDPEADAVLNARLEWTSWTLGVYGKRCVTLTGDVVRSIRTVTLPMPASHGAHTGHGTH